MEIYLNERYDNLKINTKNNIIAIYGENNSGKTRFIGDFISLIQNKRNRVFSDSDYDENREIVQILEEWDLKKELNLSKTSILRKFIFKHILEMLETNNIDLTEEFNENKNLNLILQTMNKYIKYNNEKYHLNSKFNFKTDSDLIELLFKIAIFDNEKNEVQEKWLSKSEKLNIYINLIIELESKNKIFILDCPETYLDPKEIKKLSELLNDLSKNNLIIITLRNPMLIKYLNISMKEFFYVDEGKLNKFNITNQYLLNYYYFTNENFVKQPLKDYYQFETLFNKLESVTYKEDYEKIEKDFKEITLPFLLRNIDLKSREFIGNISMLSENEKFKFILFLIFNNFKYKKSSFIGWINDYYQRIVDE